MKVWSDHGSYGPIIEVRDIPHGYRIFRWFCEAPQAELTRPQDRCGSGAGGACKIGPTRYVEGQNGNRNIALTGCATSVNHAWPQVLVSIQSKCSSP